MASLSAVATQTSSAAANAAPTFLFQAVGEMYTCGMTTVSWGYAGPKAPLSLNISNINVSQQAPVIPALTSAALQTAVARLAKRQDNNNYNGYGGSYLPKINLRVGSDLDPSSGTWTWSSVIVPQGWYQMLANMQGTAQSTSNSFFVQNGTITNCIPQYAVNASPSNTTVPPSASPSTNASSGHSHVGAIAGGLIGGIAFLAAAFSALLFCFLRHRRRHSRSPMDASGNGRWSALGIGKSRHSSYARSSLQKAHAGLPTLEADQTILGSDEEISAASHEKVVDAASDYPTVPHFDPLAHPNRTSTQTNNSTGRVSNPELPTRRRSQNAGTREAIPLERANTGTRRKPVPRYEDTIETEADGNAGSSSHTTLDSIHGRDKLTLILALTLYSLFISFYPVVEEYYGSGSTSAAADSDWTRINFTAAVSVGWRVPSYDLLLG
ncbi:hypothetical protein BGW80DRAFT_1251383 [Lactifluus volemus]|nr:hypothetical protein BGW80DRAFT_1251383 [Lactifluus volemus]